MRDNTTKIQRVAIVGQGALGIMYGAQILNHAPQIELRMVADQARIERYQSEGVYCNGEAFRFKYVLPETVTEPADMVFFTVKNKDLPEAIDAAQNQVGPNTMILSTLNGISSEAIIAETFGEEAVLYCVAQGMDAVKVGNRLTYDHIGLLCFGEKEPGVKTSRLDLIRAFCEQAKIPCEISDEMVKRLWGKFLLNVGVNQTVSVYGTEYSCVQEEGEPRQIMLEAMKEVVTLAALEGVDLTLEDIPYWLAVLDSVSPQGKPSMRQDVEARRISEVDDFSGMVLKLAHKHGINTPVNRNLYEAIKKMEDAY